MIIYEATKKEFLDHVNNNSIEEKIYETYQEKIGKTTKSEINSWKNSMRNMARVINSEKIPEDSGIAIEFKIPLTSNRIDFIISGYNSEKKGIAIIIELKQWAEAEAIKDKDGLIKTFLGGGIRETTHPSYQAWSYCKLISDFNESVQKEEIFLFPCAYLHNFDKINQEEIFNPIYKDYLDKARPYLSGDGLKLREFIEKHIKKGDQKKNLYEINSGKIRPSKSLQDTLANMMKGNKEFTLLDSQKIVYENILSSAKKSYSDEKKRVIIVDGGPGTGKSVLAINLLADLINEEMVCQYVSKNAAPRNVYASKLKGTKRISDINHLFRGSGSYVDIKKNMFDTLLVDEAHRLNEKSGMFKNKGENQIKEIINASKLSVFFIDENQKIDLSDIGSKKEIEKFAKEAKADISYYELTSQFRCNGSDGYLAWIDDVLEIRKTANYDGFDIDYDIRILETPNEIKELIEEKNKINNKARIVAGYCWNWIREGKNNPKIFDINFYQDKFHASWNLGSSSTWAIDEESVKEIGCIHTSQGLEFDYVGVIIGPDMRYDGEKIITDFNERAKTDNSLKGIKKLHKENPEKAKKIADNIIKNTYRTLMTRGQKGCYVYCTDKKLKNYLQKRIASLKFK